MESDIKQIVISGGGHSFFTFYGIIKEANLQKYWNHENIEYIYATSAGSLLAFIICLKKVYL